MNWLHDGNHLRDRDWESSLLLFSTSLYYICSCSSAPVHSPYKLRWPSILHFDWRIFLNSLQPPRRHCFRIRFGLSFLLRACWPLHVAKRHMQHHATIWNNCVQDSTGTHVCRTWWRINTCVLLHRFKKSTVEIYVVWRLRIGLPVSHFKK